ncbi:hypothetical protein GO613_09345 [Azoarcus communis]|uniref:WD40/YVTN/BNR-like repeat-containing protein n=1 Tax=Parazoarcus communis TaxID=41977 RepID=UPI0014599418|nr:sialidase family protein [Parazoarcus communis]NMG48304.1 hypothetical protein [Parazoarcus communis]
MAWVQQSSISVALSGAWYGADGRWLLRGTGSELRTTSDFVSYAASVSPSSPLGMISVISACSDGARWYIVGDNGLAFSTDGMTGVEWEVSPLSTLYAPTVQRGARAIGYGNGRLVAVGAGGVFAVSEDSGETWLRKGQLPSAASAAHSYSAIYNGTTWVVTAGSVSIAVSNDDGATWAFVSPAGLSVGPAGAFPGGWLVSRPVTGNVYRSFDEGQTWSNSGQPASISSFYTRPGALYQFDSTADAIYSITNPTGARDSIDASGKPSYPWGMGAGDRLVLVTANSFQGPFVAPAVHDEVPTDPPPPPETRIELDWDIEIIPAPEARVELAWNIAISNAAHVSLEWQVRVISDAAVGGLDGAGGWPAVPSGRWAPIVIVGDDELSASVVGVVSVRHTRRESAIAEFVLHSPGIDLMGLPGQRVAIGIAERTTLGIANPQVVFNGVIQAATVDIETGDVSCTCSDMLQEAASAMTREQIDDVIGGRWHQAYFGEPTDSREYLEQCIQTVPADYARALDGSVVKLPWWGVGLRTASVRLSDYWSSSMQLTLPTRDEMLTRCVVKAEYRYTRMWGRGAIVQYAQPLSFYLPYLALGTVVPSKLWLTKSMIEGAISSVDGWRLVGPLSVASPRAQTINIGTELSPFMYNIRADVAPTLALSFSALMAARWTQSVTEYYEINVVSSDLEALIGRPVAAQIGATLTAAFDLADWVSDWTVPPLAVGGSVVFPVGDIIVPYQPARAMPADRDAMLLTMLDVARCDRVMQSARSGRLTFSMPLRPDMWLDRFVSVETAQIHASGPVHTVEHTLDSSTGDASSRVTLAVGLHGSVVPADPDWSLPTAVDTTPSGVLADYSFTVGTYVGGHPSSPPFDPDTMVGFVTNYEWANTEVEFYEHGLEIQSPAVSAAVRDPVEFPALASIDIEIPMFEMEIL